MNELAVKILEGIKSFKENKKILEKKMKDLESTVGYLSEEAEDTKKFRDGLDIDKFSRVEERVRKFLSKAEDRINELRKSVSNLDSRVSHLEDHSIRVDNLREDMKKGMEQIKERIHEIGKDEEIIDKRSEDRARDIEDITGRVKDLEEFREGAEEWNKDRKDRFDREIERITEVRQKAERDLEELEKISSGSGMDYLHETEGLLKEAFTDIEHFKRSMKKDVEKLEKSVKDLNNRIGYFDETDSSGS